MEPDLPASTKRRSCTKFETFVNFWEHLLTDSLSYPLIFCTVVQIGVRRLDNNIIRDMFGQTFSKFYQELSNETPPFITTIACAAQVHVVKSAFQAYDCAQELTGEVALSND